jgi:hypothetical protein
MAPLLKIALGKKEQGHCAQDQFSPQRTLTNTPRGLTYFQRSALGPATISSGSLDRNRRMISRSDDGENPQPDDKGWGFFVYGEKVFYFSPFFLKGGF